MHLEESTTCLNNWIVVRSIRTPIVQIILAKSEAGDAYRGGAYIKKRVVRYFPSRYVSRRVNAVTTRRVNFATPGRQVVKGKVSRQ